MNKKEHISQQTVCWVPTCGTKFNIKKKCLPLCSVPSKLKEIWLSLATRAKEGTPDENIFFCEDHFQINNFELTVDNVYYSQKQNYAIPNTNMPDRVCRTCNEFMGINEPIFTLSSCFLVDVPKGVQEIVTFAVNPMPLYQVFRYCFTEFNIPVDPISIICSKCYENIWLFYAYKKRAINVEDELSQDFTPKEYGQIVLCRTCSTERSSNFFSLEEESELGVLLQNVLSNKYLPDVVPLRVCLNCHNILQKINSFYKHYTNTEKIKKRRALLNAKLNSTNLSKTSSTTVNQNVDKEDNKKRFEKENLLLAQLMLQYGQPLKNNLYIIENWNPICQKLKEQGINHNVHSLINNWKKLQNITKGKKQNNVPLTVLELLVLQFLNGSSNTSNYSLESISNRPEISVTPVNDSPSTRRSTVIVPSPSGTPHTHIAMEISQKPFSIQEKFDILHAMTQYRNKNNIPGDPSTLDHIWPEIMQMLRVEGSQRDLESVKNAWSEMKETAKTGLAEKKILEEIDVDLLNFMKDNQNKTVNTITDAIKNSARQNGVSVKTRKVSHNGTKNPARQNGVSVKTKKVSDHDLKRGRKKGQKDKVKSSTTTKKHPGRPSLYSFDQKMAFANAIRAELNLTTPEERKKKNIWIELVQRVADKKILPYSVDKLMSLWAKLKTSATIYEKDGKDMVDNVIWDVLKMVQNEKIRSPVKNPTIKSAIQTDQRNNQTTISKEVQPACSITTGTETHKRSLEGVFSSSDSSINQTSSTSGNQSSVNKKLKTDPHKNDKKNKSTDLDIETFADTSTDSSAFIKRQLFMKIKDTYKEIKRNGDLEKYPRIWMEIFRRMYDNGFDIISQQDAAKNWQYMRMDMTARVRNNKPLSEFLQEVYRFTEKCKNDRNSIQKSKQKSDILPKKKKPYEYDSLFMPHCNINDSNVTPVKKKPFRQSSLNATVLDEDEMLEENEKRSPSKETCKKSWSEEEQMHYITAIADNLPFINSRKFWQNVTEACKLKGYNRSNMSIRLHYGNLKKKVENKLERGIKLDNIDKKVHELMIKRMESTKSESKNNPTNTVTNKESNTNKLIIVNNTDNNVAISIEPEKKSINSRNKLANPIVREAKTIENVEEPLPKRIEPLPKPIEPLPKPIEPLPKPIEPLPKPIEPLPKPIEPLTPVDMSYDYVSLQDLQQSTTWSMPNLQPMVKDEKKSYLDSPSNSKTTVDTDDGEDSRGSTEEDTINHGYVGAKDLGMTIIIESEEE